MGLLPLRTRERIEAAGSITDVARALDPHDGVPGLPEWQCVPCPATRLAMARTCAAATAS